MPARIGGTVRNEEATAPESRVPDRQDPAENTQHDRSPNISRRPICLAAFRHGKIGKA